MLHVAIVLANHRAQRVVTLNQSRTRLAAGVRDLITEQVSRPLDSRIKLHPGNPQRRQIGAFQQHVQLAFQHLESIVTQIETNG